MDDLRIRDAVPADLDVPVVGGTTGEYREQLTRHLARAAEGTGVLLVAERGSEIVGRAFVEQWGTPPGAWLGGLIVDAPHRRGGVAVALIRQSEVRAARLGYDELFLTVAKDNDPAIRLYDKLEYERVGEDYSSGLIAADGTVVHPSEAVWVMSRTITAD
jgi:ribosomal protein S18 acetylase RimI-like enzyme